MTDFQTEKTIELIDREPCEEQFRRELLAGLRAPRGEKTAPCKYLYDERGSALFDAICELPEYYPTRTEIAIMRTHGEEMAEAIGEDALIIELGSGSSLKTRILLDHLKQPAGYVPVDISREHLAQAAQSLSDAYPRVEVLPLCADYMTEFTVPEPSRPAARRVSYFPGSTIGNFHREDAQRFLARLARLCSPRPESSGSGGLLIGVDLKKDVETLEAAYNDAQRVTAEFNFNLLRRINRELGGDVDVSSFDFRAVWNEEESRIESYLISRVAQTITIAGEPIDLAANERIRTECSYKFTVEQFADMAQYAGWRARQIWTDEDGLFSVQFFETGQRDQ